MGLVNTYNIWEASGILSSRQNPGIVWIHNDSGFPGSVFALSTNGTLLAHWSIPNIGGGDWEDISYGPGPNPAYDYIYLGDIGDNFSTRISIGVYRFPEPAVYGYQSNSPPECPLNVYEAFTLYYPDGPHNAEGMLVDPISGDLFIFTKLDFSSRVYRATAAELDESDTVTLTFMVEIPFKKVSAADITRDGSMIALRRGGTAALWLRSPDQTVDQAVAGSSIPLPLATEPNGEAIAFDPFTGGYYTTSEQSSQPIYYYARTDKTLAQPRVFVPGGASWFYDDSGFGEDPNWIEPDFDLCFFLEGNAPLGYGSAEATTINYGDPDSKTVTSYFVYHFQGGDLAGLSNLALRICFSDGVAAYLNGTEILREKLPRGAAWDTLATASNYDLRNSWLSYPVNPSLLVPGDNVLAVEVHRQDPAGPSLNFDAQLVEAHIDLPPRFVGQPRLVDGSCVMRLAGPNGQLANIQSSADFQSWSAAGSVVFTNGQATFQDPANPQMRFYRIAP